MYIHIHSEHTIHTYTMWYYICMVLSGITEYLDRKHCWYREVHIHMDQVGVHGLVYVFKEINGLRFISEYRYIFQFYIHVLIMI